MARHTLDNPIWNSATGAHEHLARRKGGAVRYKREVSPFAGMDTYDRRSFDDLRDIVEENEIVALFTGFDVDVPAGWSVLTSRLVEQMVMPTQIARPDRTEKIQALSVVDVPEMLALASATAPGPFLRDTFETGSYVGIRGPKCELAAMAGERLLPMGHVEISAVCTAPDHRGKGHAAALVTTLARRAWILGRVPFLHVKGENRARELYERIGFRKSRDIRLNVIRREA